MCAGARHFFRPFRCVPGSECPNFYVVGKPCDTRARGVAERGDAPGAQGNRIFALATPPPLPPPPARLRRPRPGLGTTEEAGKFFWERQALSIVVSQEILRIVQARPGTISSVVP